MSARQQWLVVNYYPTLVQRLLAIWGNCIILHTYLYKYVNVHNFFEFIKDTEPIPSITQDMLHNKDFIFIFAELINTNELSILLKKSDWIR